MNGLAAYRPIRYQSGGSISGDIGSLGGLNAPIDIGLGAFNPTPMGIAAAVSPVGLGVQTANAVLSAFNALSAMTQQQQEAAPIEEASVNTIADVAVSPVAAPTAPVETAIAPATMGLAAMNAAEQAQAQTEAEAAPDSIADAISAIASDPATAAAVADAAANAATAGVGSEGGHSADGNDAGAGASATGTAGVGDEGGHSADGNNSGDGTGDGDGEREGGLIRKKYANGGLAYYGNNMNSANFPMEMRYQAGGMTPVAQAVANQGRMGDSMMVHMNPMEVAGLQALARSQGTSMTTNPQTGMPEAFNLSAFLPFIAGMALNAFAPGVGSAIGSALGTSSAVGTGLAVGGATALGTGSLKKGLMAGLGAYGGAGLGEGLVSTATPSQAAIAAPEAVGGVQGSTGLTIPTESMVPTTTLPAATSPFQAPLNSPLGVTDGMGLNLDSTFVPSTAEAVGGVTGSSGLTAAPMTPTPGPFANMSGKDIFKYGSAAYSGTAGLAQPEYEPPKSTAMLRPYTYSFNPVTGAYEPRPGDTSERLYGESVFTPGPVTPAAAGGLMASMRETDFDDRDDMYAAGGLAAFKQGGKMQRPKGRPLTGAAPYDFMGRDESMLQSVEKNFAKGGRFLVGNGDGMSDDIPAVIADKQPARLADGEFVIPADVVSHLGNGSSKAGAERLHDMMRRIRKERTGRDKQAPAVKAEKYMPA